MTLLYREGGDRSFKPEHSGKPNEGVSVKRPLEAIEALARKAFQREMVRTEGAATSYAISVIDYPIDEQLEGVEYVSQRRLNLLAQILGAMSDQAYGITEYKVVGADPDDLDMLVQVGALPAGSVEGTLHSVILSQDSIDAVGVLYTKLQNKSESPSA